MIGAHGSLGQMELSRSAYPAPFTSLTAASSTPVDALLIATVRSVAHLARLAPALETQAGTSLPGLGVSRSTRPEAPARVSCWSVAAIPAVVAALLLAGFSFLPFCSTTVLPKLPVVSTNLGLSLTSRARAAARHVLHSV